MKKLRIILIMVFLLLYGAPGYAQTGIITVTVTQINDTKGGKVKIGLYDVQGFPVVGQGVKEINLPVKTDTTMHVFGEISSGRYAIAIFQDINNDDKLNKNFFGAPQEPYGFSKNTYGTFGPPDFQKVAFDIKDGQSLSLTINLE